MGKGRFQVSGGKIGFRSWDEEHLLSAGCLLSLNRRRSGERDLRYACLLPTAYCRLPTAFEWGGMERGLPRVGWWTWRGSNSRPHDCQETNHFAFYPSFRIFSMALDQFGASAFAQISPLFGASGLNSGTFLEQLVWTS